MKVLWSEESVLVLVALEMQLAERFSEAKATAVISELVRRVDRLQDHPELGRIVPELGSGSFESSSISGIECCTAWGPMRSRS